MVTYNTRVDRYRHPRGLPFGLSQEERRQHWSPSPIPIPRHRPPPPIPLPLVVPITRVVSSPVVVLATAARRRVGPGARTTAVARARWWGRRRGRRPRTSPRAVPIPAVGRVVAATRRRGRVPTRAGPVARPVPVIFAVARWRRPRVSPIAPGRSSRVVASAVG